LLRVVNFQFVNRQELPKHWLILGSLATTAILVLLLCVFFEPRWESNDDVGMSMVAHGYGIAAIGVPNLIFSNVLWGYLVRAIPQINGVLGYSIATLSVLVIVGAVVVYGLYQLGVNYINCLLILALILVRPVLFPQFTINAGLLMVGSIICWHLYIQLHDRLTLVLGCFLAFFSYLIRSQEFLLVLMVALPLLAWRELFLPRFAKIAFLTFIVAIAVAAFVDHQSYQGDEWKAFNELNLARAAFTDFGAGVHLKQHPGILQQHGYSNNDVDLIGNWFFIDPAIANPKALQSMLAELGPLSAQTNALANAWIGMQSLWHPNLLPIVLAALLLMTLRFSWQGVASWGLYIAAVLSLALLGRPGFLRVYVPLVCLLLVAPFLKEKVSAWRNNLGTCGLFVAVIMNSSHVFSESNALQTTTTQTRKELATFPNNPVVNWGDTFPFETAYPVLSTPSTAMSYQIYSLGCFTLAPFSVAVFEQQRGHGMIDLLVKESGVSILTNNQQLKYLEIYCKEHLHGQLKELSAKQYGTVVVSQRRCEVIP
jgi:hypothetical protein